MLSRYVEVAYSNQTLTLISDAGQAFPRGKASFPSFAPAAL